MGQKLYAYDYQILSTWFYYFSANIIYASVNRIVLLHVEIYIFKCSIFGQGSAAIIMRMVYLKGLPLNHMTKNLDKKCGISAESWLALARMTALMRSA